MATSNKNLSAFKRYSKLDITKNKFAIIVSEWNSEVTESLYSGAFQTLVDFGANKLNIIRRNVPGSYELPLASQWLLEKDDSVDVVICLGCVIQGETRHFEFICNAVSQGLKEVALKYNKPVIFGILTTDSQKQALERAGGKHGNKGDESAYTAIKMLELKEAIK